MKTLQECKDEVAKKYGHDSWDRLQNLNPTWEYDEAAELYAQQFKDELEQGAEYVVRLSDSIGKLCDENSRLLEEKAKLIEALADARHEMRERDMDYSVLNEIGKILTSPQ